MSYDKECEVGYAGGQNADRGFARLQGAGSLRDAPYNEATKRPPAVLHALEQQDKAIAGLYNEVDRMESRLVGLLAVVPSDPIAGAKNGC
jgi:hypothetical protein